ncbi:hypothetical protein CRYUN_Cryun02cG0172100 [Craigia yunnanensis]
MALPIRKVLLTGYSFSPCMMSLCELSWLIYRICFFLLASVILQMGLQKIFMASLSIEFIESVRQSTWIRWDYSNPGYLDALKHLTDLKEGKIKTVALTNFDTERLQIILENGIPVISNQVQHSIVDMHPQQKMTELCQLTGVKLITSGSLSFSLCMEQLWVGLLSKKFLDTNLAIPLAGPPLNTPSPEVQKGTNSSSLFYSSIEFLNRNFNDMAPNWKLWNAVNPFTI